MITMVAKRNLLSLVFILVFLGAELSAIAQSYNVFLGSEAN